MNFKRYATAKDTPRRMTRKTERNKTWLFNRKLRHTLRKSRVEARQNVENRSEN